MHGSRLRRVRWFISYLIKSDHRLILLKTSNCQSQPQRNQFRLMVGWTEHPNFNQFVQDNWCFDRDTQKSTSLDRNGTPQQRDEELRIRIKLEEVLDQEELMWKQKACDTWLLEGDRNTKYFHSRALFRRENGEWCYDEETLRNEATRFFLQSLSG
ncbi:uncharacterized protein LOC120148122 [Hibiscus syriacus]|uniref:uncharacterized protein LOC120148122 n=1 Tax=Hibiscus syriacus TaxID=106335 RepID=UPI001921024E|nr:uncharacterized protein LOC120148122 [Hibiscus syriacus]